MTTTTDNPDLIGLSVGQLQTKLANLGYNIPAREQKAGRFGIGTRTAVEQFQSANKIEVTGKVDDTTAAALSAAIEEQTYVVTGAVRSPDLPGLGGVTVQLVDKNIGGDVQLGKSEQTKTDGSFEFTRVISLQYLVQHNKAHPDLQVQVVVGRAAVASSDVRYSAPRAVSVDVILPAGMAGLPSEYETLTANLTGVYKGKLGDLQESDTQQDITYLANKTGWDARAVALAALADQFSQIQAAPPPPPTKVGKTAGAKGGQAKAAQGKTAQAKAAKPTPAPAAVSIRPEFYYALFRAGLPANQDTLFQARPSSVETILQQAVAQGVIPQSLAAEVPGAVASFGVLSASHVLTAAPSAGVSTLQEMLAPTLSDAGQQQQFAQLYVQHEGDWASFWPAVKTALGAKVAQQLQLMGQLYHLTVNNQPLVAALVAAAPGGALGSAAELAAAGYDEAATWLPLIGEDIPAGIPGTGAEQASNYAELMAAQVRVAFPTAVLAHQIEHGVVPIADAAPVATEVHQFLSAQQGQFEIGLEPVEAFIARTGVAAPSAAAVTQIKRVQRVYQLTPDDSSLSVLLRHNLDSAYAITRYDSPGFVRAFSEKLGGETTAGAIHARAKQVFTSVLSVAVEYLKARTGVDLGGLAPIKYSFPPQEQQPTSPVVAYATLEELFGSLDYCNCSDCGSILSPAAYLVDLLHFIDQPAPTGGADNPQDVLLGRRPDLQYLPLTCANTNTALPYIDIVNETLEYYVANGLKLDNYQGHDTGNDVTSAELIATPQYVNDAAYAVLEHAFFPPPLPFNRPLTLLRLQLRSLGIELPEAMAALRSDDRMVNSDTPTSYGWRDILIERLAISREEYQLFTDPGLGLTDLYGLPATMTPAQALQKLQQTSLQEFSRRLGISYDDIEAIVKTEFINPNAALIPRLERLNAPFATLKQLHDTLGTPQSIEAEFISALPAGLDATEYNGAAPDDYHAVVNWVTDPKIYPAIMGLITISNPSGDGSDCSGASLQLRYSNPDNAQNLLSATELLKLIRFIRLWQKVAPLISQDSDTLAIADTDHILSALYPAADLPAGTSDVANDPHNRTLLDEGFAILLPRIGFLMRTMDALSLSGDANLDQLLACWAPIGTVGPTSLYQRMFLSPALLEQDPGAQTATVPSAVTVNDVLQTALNADISQAQIIYKVGAGEDAAQVATGIAAAINTNTSLDPVTTLPLEERFFATSRDDVIVIKTGFKLACSILPAAATETLTVATASAISQTVTVGGAATPGDTLTTTINGQPVSYTVAAGDTLALIAEGIAAAVNASGAPDPYSGLPLNALVIAYVDPAANTVVNLITAGAGAPFTLACSYQPAGTGTYTAAVPTPAAHTATITGAVHTGDTLITTINGVDIPYTVLATDTTTAALAASIAAKISADVQLDPATQLPLSSIVQATSAGNVISLTAVDPADTFTLACSVPKGGESYTAAGPFPETVEATVAGSIPAGVTLTTTVNGVPVPYIALTGDTSASIATAIAAALNAATAADATTFLPVNQVVTANAAAGTVTVTAKSPTTPFTLSTSVSEGGYVAGRQPAPFADDGYGDFLSDASQTLFAHEPTLCAACNLTASEFALIVDALGFNAKTPLSLANVSAVFSYGWLAHALGLSIVEFLLFRTYTGLDPFAPPVPGASPLDPGTPPAPAEPAVIRLARLLSAIGNAGLNTDQALYLMWNQDLSGISAPPLSDITGLALALRADFAAVDAAFTLQDDPKGAIAQGLMTLVYGATASGFFFGLLNNTFSTSTPYGAPPGLSGLASSVVAAANGRLSYDELRKQLTFHGVLDATTQAAIDAVITVTTTDGTDNVAAGDGVTFTPGSMTNIASGVPLVIDAGPAQETVIVSSTTATTFTANTVRAHNGTVTPFSITSDPALKTAIDELASANQEAVAPFFASYPELEPLYHDYVTSTQPPDVRRKAFLASFLPILKAARKQEQALTSITASAGTDPSFAAALLQDPTIVHAGNDPTAPAITDLTAIEQAGLSGAFYLSNDTASAPDQQLDSVSDLAFAQTATIQGPITIGDVLTTTINGVAIPYTIGAFTLACTVSPGATESLVAAAPSAVSQTVTVGGAISPGDILTAVLDGVPIPYTVLAADTPATIAANLAAEINATAVQDPTWGLPLNALLQATAAGAVITIDFAQPGAQISLSQLAGNIASAINALTTPDPATTLPLNELVSATASGEVIVIAGLNPSGLGGHFALACTVSPGASETYTAASQLPAGIGGGPIAIRLNGYITAPQDGVYDIDIAVDPGAAIALEVDGATIAGQQVAGLWANESEISLVAGKLVPITLTVSSLETTLSVSWRTAGVGWELIPGQYLYSGSLVARLSDIYVRFLKATSLAAALSLTAPEIADLAAAASFSVNTTDKTAVPTGAATFTPASMTNIVAGTTLIIDRGDAQETVTVTGTTKTSFAAVTTKSHDGSAAAFPVVSETSADIGKGWLNFLTTTGNPDPATAAQLDVAFTALLDFARLKQSLSPKDSRLLAVLQDPGSTLSNGQSALLSLTGWSQASLDALLTRFFSSSNPASLSDVENLRRVYDAYQIVRTSRLAGAALISAITNAPTPMTVSALQSALRAGYAPSDWLTVVRPINDAARIQQRDALVAYILQQQGDAFEASCVIGTTAAVAATGANQLVLASAAGITVGMSVQGAGIAQGTAVAGIAGATVTVSQALPATIPLGTRMTFVPANAVNLNTPDDLYQSLLIDPETQPAVLTSRIRLALSSVQLFIERALRTLEPLVSAADINSEQWIWMKRYRVWQANREVFLWPENWLFPELRDDQSPFFQQAMSALLQGDITDDAAASAYLDYLTNLEEVAKLEACGMYYQPATADTDEATYVVSRTAGAHRKHYVRQLQGGSWTPWAQAQIDCEDVPTTPIVWNGRLFLFWLKVVKQTIQGPIDPSALPSGSVSDYAATDLQTLISNAQSQNQVSIGAVLCWSEFYNGKWQPTKTSDVNLPTSLSASLGGGGLGTFDASGPYSFEQSTRGLLRLVPAQFTGSSWAAAVVQPEVNLSSDVLILGILLGWTLGPNDSPYAYGGFLLHNSHSLPIRFDDITVPATRGGPVPLWSVLDWPSPSRTLEADPGRDAGPVPPFSGALGNGTFTATYEDVFGTGAVYTNPVLDYTWQPRFVVPQDFLPDEWDTPFIYEDRRHVFYVKTAEILRSIRVSPGYGISTIRSSIAAGNLGISPPVLRDPSPNRKPTPMVPPGATATDAATIRRYLNQSTDLTAALNLPSVVTYGGRVISPTASGPAAAQNGRGA